MISALLTALSLVFCGFDVGGVASAGIAVLAALLLLVPLIASREKQRIRIAVMLVAWLLGSALLLTHYSLARDRVRWLFLSGVYKARLAEQPVSGAKELQHIEWDGWGFAGADTTVFLVFNPTDSFSALAGAAPPVRAPGLPCDVVRVRRLEKRWYAVLFYTDTSWGQGGCP